MSRPAWSPSRKNTFDGVVRLQHDVMAMVVFIVELNRSRGNHHLPLVRNSMRNRLEEVIHTGGVQVVRMKVSGNLPHCVPVSCETNQRWVDWGQPDDGAEEPTPGVGDGGLVERLLSSESDVMGRSAGGFGGGDSGTGRMGTGEELISAEDAGVVAGAGRGTKEGGSGGGGISVDGQDEAGVTVGVVRRRFARRSGAMTGDGGRAGVSRGGLAL
eukprot:s4270_g3.t1